MRGRVRRHGNGICVCLPVPPHPSCPSRLCLPVPHLRSYTSMREIQKGREGGKERGGRAVSAVEAKNADGRPPPFEISGKLRHCGV